MFYNKHCCSIRGNEKLTNMSEFSKEVAAKWNKLTEAEKEPFKKMQEKDQLRHQKEKNDLETKGFFINSDGENSKDLFLKDLRKQVQVVPKPKMSPYFIFNI